METKRIERLIVVSLAVIATVTMAFIASCSDVSERKPNDVTPGGATNIKKLGNGWITFELYLNGNTKKFLYHKASGGYDGYECITEITD